MDEHKRNLVGSESRDKFKSWHKKTLPKKFYALDIDFVFVEKFPTPAICAIVDYKKLSDGITFSEVVAYNDLMQHYPIYIIGSDDLSSFTIWRYEGGDPKPNPPVPKLRLLKKNITLAEYEQWETQLRERHRMKHSNKTSG